MICKSTNFLAAVQKMQRALYEFYIRGIKTNIAFLDNVLRHPEFLSGAATTSFIERNPGLFAFDTREIQQASKLLNYLANMASYFCCAVIYYELMQSQICSTAVLLNIWCTTVPISALP